MGSPKTTWACYFIQGEEGEDHKHPNVFRIQHDEGEAIRFKHFMKFFPLNDSGDFHFRFRVNGKFGFLWLDILDPATPIPLLNGKVISKVLRLDKPIRSGLQLRRKPRKVGRRVPSSSTSHSSRPPRPRGRPHHLVDDMGQSSHRSPSAPSELRSPRDSDSSRGGQPPPGIHRQDVRKHRGSSSGEEGKDRHHKSRSRHRRRPPSYNDDDSSNDRSVSSEPESLDDFLSGSGGRESKQASKAQSDRSGRATLGVASAQKPMQARTRSATPPPTQVPKSVMHDGQTVGPVTKAEMDAIRMGTHDGTHVWNPDKSDMMSKSDQVRQAMARRADEKKARTDNAVKELKDREIAQKSMELEKERLNQVLGPRLTQWAEDNRKLKNIRTLLSTLHTVMWQGSRWQEVSMAKLLTPPDVKKQYRKAMLVVHPDKSAGRTAEQLLIAQRVFDAINRAYEEFLKTEGA